MTIYFLVYILLVLCSCLDKDNTNDKIKIFFFFILTVFAGLRYEVGVDYIGYEETYDEVVGKIIREPGGAFIMDSVREYGGTVQLYLFVMAVITQFFIYKTFIRNKNWFWLSTYVYYCISLFYLASFNGVRQYAAMAVSTWSLQLIEEDRKNYYFLVILLAAFFLHFSVIIFIPLYFFIKRSCPLWVHFLFLMISIIISKFISIIATLTSFEIYNIAERDVTVGVAFFSFLMLILGRKIEDFYSNTILYNMNTLCLCTLIIVIMQSSGMFIMICQRINNYFLFAFLLIIPCSLYSMHKKRRVVCLLFLVIFCFLYLIRTIVFEGQRYMLVPYDYNLVLFNY